MSHDPGPDVICECPDCLFAYASLKGVEPIYRLPDYSAWLTPENLETEDRLWLSCNYYSKYADLVKEWLGDGASVVEFGCGTGLVQTQLNPDVLYIGIDANEGCVQLARKRSEDNITKRLIVHADVRTIPVAQVNLTCSFAFLKHFALFEWKTVAANVMRPGNRSVFTIPLVDSDYEDGAAYPHTRVSLATIQEAAAMANHRVVTTRWIEAVGEHAIFTEQL